MGGDLLGHNSPWTPPKVSPFALGWHRHEETATGQDWSKPSTHGSPLTRSSEKEEKDAWWCSLWKSGDGPRRTATFSRALALTVPPDPPEPTQSGTAPQVEWRPSTCRLGRVGIHCGRVGNSRGTCRAAWENCALQQSVWTPTTSR